MVCISSALGYMYKQLGLKMMFEGRLSPRQYIAALPEDFQASSPQHHKHMLRCRLQQLSGRVRSLLRDVCAVMLDCMWCSGYVAQKVAATSSKFNLKEASEYHQFIFNILYAWPNLRRHRILCTKLRRAKNKRMWWNVN